MSGELQRLQNENSVMYSVGVMKPPSVIRKSGSAVVSHADTTKKNFLPFQPPGPAYFANPRQSKKSHSVYFRDERLKPHPDRKEL
jgi:hypothetical protein